MKKKLEAELMSLAHKILKLKNKSELRVLRDEAKILHEKLAVLLFVEEYLSEVKPTISFTEVEEMINEGFQKEAIAAEPEIVLNINTHISTVNPEDVIVDILEEKKSNEISIKEDSFLHPEIVIEEATTTENETIPQIEEFEEIKEETITLNFGLETEPEPEPIIETPAIPEPKTKSKSKQVSLEEILEDIQPIATFVKATESTKEPIEKKVEESSKSIKKVAEPHHKPVSINEKLRKSVTIGLNDKIAFVKHLFGGSDADFIRVISQLNTFDKYQEAYDFIQEIVKPDYNNWVGKEEVEERFMHIIENKFS